MWKSQRELKWCSVIIWLGGVSLFFWGYNYDSSYAIGIAGLVRLLAYVIYASTFIIERKRRNNT